MTFEEKLHAYTHYTAIGGCGNGNQGLYPGSDDELLSGEWVSLRLGMEIVLR